MKDLAAGMKVAVMLICIFMFYMAAATFFSMPDTGAEQAKTIVPFLLGVIATLVGFYWGNSKKDEHVPPFTVTDADRTTETTTKTTESTKDGKV